VTSLPDWLVERAALDEVAPAFRPRLDSADPKELADRIAKLRDDNTAELAGYPAGPAIAQIEARAAAVRSSREARRRRTWNLVGLAAGMAAVATIFVVVIRPVTSADDGDPDPQPSAETSPGGDGIREKGGARLLAFRQVGEHAERLEPDAVVNAGDIIQLRYNAGGHRYGVIASLDGSGVVTLHYPVSEDAPPAATAIAGKTTSLGNAYALDDAPGFERFIIITADAPIDLARTLAALRDFARRSDSAEAKLDLPHGMHQWSLRLRKPDRANEAP